MRPVEVSVTNVGDSGPVVLDQYISPFSVSLFGRIDSGTPTYTVQYTSDNVFADGFNPATASWTNHIDLTAQTANGDSNLAYPVSAVRLRVTAGTGKVTLIVRQAGIA